MRNSKGLPLKRKIREAKKQKSYWDTFDYELLYQIIAVTIGLIILGVTIYYWK